VKAYVAVTDNDWYRFLKAYPEHDEVNFWQPGGNRLFSALQPGQPFLFKLHAPENFIAGGGFFTHASLLPSSLAWEAFSEKNGAVSLLEMRRRVEKYRRSTSDLRPDYRVGCIILKDPFFFERQDWIPAPQDFHANIVQGKTYDLHSGAGEALWRMVLDRMQRQLGGSRLVGESREAMYGAPTWVRQRLGQGTFRILITDVYERRCAVTGEKALPVLEAAHIRPVSEGGLHQIDNGLLLRSDVHTLFDRGYVTITPALRFEVSRRLRKEFDNGEHYYGLRGVDIRVPKDPEERPSREFLEWHADTMFLR